MAYVSYPVDLAPSDLAARAIAYIQSMEPGWQPAPGGFDWLLIESVATMLSEAAGLFSDATTSIFRHAGLNIFNVPPIDAAPASATTTWTVQDTAGYTVPAGTQISYQAAGGDQQVFATTRSVTIPPGSSTATGVVVTATVPGAAGNGLTAPTVLDSTVPWVTGVTQAIATSGGEDGETDDQYLARLPIEIEVQKTPVRERDFAAVALRVPGVGRAVALDGWNTTSDTLGNEKTVGVVVATTTGQSCTVDVKAAVKAAIEAVREVNFVVGVADPTTTSITIAYAATCYPGYLTTDVKARVDAAILAFLDPAWWGVPVGQTGVDSTTWLNEPVVRVNDLVAVIDGVDGVRAVTSVLVNGGGDVTLAGRVGLPAPQPPVGAITAT